MAFVLISLILCSCNQNSADTSDKISNDTAQVKTIYESIDQLKNNIIDKTYDNIKFSENFYINFPQISKVDIFDSKPVTLSSSDTYASFDKCFDFFFGDIYKENDKANLYRFKGMEISEKEGTYPDTLPLCSDYLDKIKSEKANIDLFVYGDKNGYLEFTNNGLRSVFCGKAAKLDNYDGYTPAMYFPTANHKASKYIKILNNSDLSDKYKLLDGEISLSEAVKLTEKFIDENTVISSQCPFVSHVCDIKPVKMTDSIYGLSMSITREYNGVLIDAADMESDGAVTNSPSSDKKNYSLLPGNVFMLSSDKPDSIVGVNLNHTAENVQSYTKIISPEKAVDIISSSVTGATELDSQSLEFVYTPYKENEEDEISHYSVSWKMTAYNNNDNLTYCLYVNAINGDFHYFTM